MRLLKLNIEKLYGHYNYHVDFNEDVTFLYGGNGSGKTTILTIITYIIRGEIYKLFNYEFENIELIYKNDIGEEKIYIRSEKKDRIELNKDTSSGFQIFKKSYYQDNNILELNYLNNSYIIREDEIKSISNRYDGLDLKIRLFEMYPVFNDISNRFNYAYIPIDEKSIMGESGIIYTKRNAPKEYLINENNTMSFVEELIRNEVNYINNGQNKIMSEFRNNVLKSLVDVNKSSIFNIDLDIKEYINSFNIDKDDILKIGESYVDILGYLNILDKDTRDNTLEFFTKIGELKEKLDKNSENISLDDIWKLSLCFDEIEKLERIVILSKKMEEDKKELRSRMQIYLDTINDFLNYTNEKKYALIKNQKLYFYVEETDSYIDIYKLSSGEKQIVIFFANLIFTLDEKESGIFLVDEPEISLHLAWQNIYVDKILEIAPMIQLVFATHSPEIISKHHDKVFKINREIVTGN